MSNVTNFFPVYIVSFHKDSRLYLFIKVFLEAFNIYLELHSRADASKCPLLFDSCEKVQGI